MDTQTSKSSFLMGVMVAAVIVVIFFLLALLGLAVDLGFRNHWFSAGWFQNLAQEKYDKDGIQFSYYRDWRVVEQPAGPPTYGYTMRYGQLMRTIQDHAPTVNVEGPHGAVLTFALFEPTYEESLQTYSERMRFTLTEAMGEAVTETDALERATCPIHGTNYDGFRYHFTVRPTASSMTSRYQYFFQMRSPAHKIIFSMQVPEQLVAAPDVNLILNSIKLDGEINPVSPIDYHLVDFENLDASLKTGKAIAQRASGEDLAVVTAWNQTLADLIAAKQTLDKARSDFESADILNFHTVIKTRNPLAFENQFVQRRGVANAYWRALGDWQSKLGVFQRSYGQQMHTLNVNDVRCVSESQLFVEGTGDRLSALQAAYSADKEMALECNYAVSAMETFCANHDTNYLVREMKNVDDLGRKAAQLHKQRPAPAVVRASLDLDQYDPNANTAVPAAPAQVGNKVSMILYKPADALAVIGNRTVGTGDMLDGFKIVAIDKTSVTVRSTAGATTALHLGDILK